MEPTEADDYHEIAEVTDPQLSPDGEQVAFVRTVPDGDRSYTSAVYVVPTDGGPAERFTAREGVDSEPRWSPSGDRLAFVSTRGDDTGTGQLHVLKVERGEAEPVTDVVGGVSDIAWRPDGQSVAFVQSTTREERELGVDRSREGTDYERSPPDPRVVDRLVYRSKGGYFDGKRSHVYVADLADGEVTRLTEGDYDFATPAWRDAGTLYYTVERTGDPDDNIVHDIVAYDLERGETEFLTQTTAWSLCLSVASDGRVAHSFYHGEKATMRPTELRVFDPATGRTVEPTAPMDRTVGSVSIQEQPHWGPDEDDLYFVSPEEGRFVIRRVPGGADAPPEVVVEGRHVTELDVGREQIAFVQSESDHPGEVFVASLDGSDVRQVTDVNGEYLETHAVSDPEEIWFDSAGHRVQGWLLTPPDFDPDETYPLVVQVHGGTHHMWTTAGSMWHEFQYFAARGYVVFWCNPRGSTGYGEAFSSATGRDWPATTADIMAGVDAVTEREYVDGENAFITGGSFGGYVTAWTIGQTDRFAAAVAQRGVYDKVGDYGGTDFAFKLTEWDYGATPWEDHERYWDHSPVAHADQVSTPTLLLHAEEDYRVPVSNAETYFRFLKKNGVATQLVRYPREGHGLSQNGEPAHAVDRLERIARWFDGYSDYHAPDPVVTDE